MNGLISDIRTYSKPITVSGQPEEVNLTEVFDQLKVTFKKTLKRHLPL